MDVNELIQKAAKLHANGLLTGQIADELNVSRETATWLLTHSAKGEMTGVPKDIYVDWSGIGKSSFRLRCLSDALSNIILESLEDSGQNADVVVGIALNGVPLATLVSAELGAELAIYHPNKQRWEEGEKAKSPRGTLSQNFSGIEGKDCVIVDDVITTGTTMNEAVEALENSGARPASIAVLVDKKGLEDILGVPVKALLRVTRVDRAD
ncbi:MAG TPA: orotate phosphoribosyltransferase-like protein [Candidatus Methanoperedenaceae archaeon]|nr:orotate phosphoribosyltransferase-like protein [Candidatus Methanoperedenaceae archaeon]